MEKPILSILIATNDRLVLLEKCILSLVQQNQNNVEIIIIDNSIGKTCKELVSNYPKIKYFHESRAGLSYTRNLGFKKAKGKYVAYIDDDSIANGHWINEILSFIKKYPHVKAFGGPYERYSNMKIPNWFPEKYAQLDLGNKVKIVNVGKEFLSGTNMVFDKNVLIELTGFRTDLGMSGNNIGYGEETELQTRLKRKGINVYYNPKIVVKHLINQRKISLSWLLKDKYVLGKTIVKSHGRKDTLFYHMVSIPQKLFYLFYYLLIPRRMAIKKRIYYAFGGIFSAGGAFENYIYSKISALKK
jgi:glycosyltransferase involved in cell wall biosynthesis